MFMMDAPPPPAIEIVAQLSTSTSHCQIQKRATDDEAGDQIEARCRSMTTPLGRALKGVSVDRIRACQVVLTVNAVHNPRLLNVGNCKGSLSVSDVGSQWVGQVEKAAGIKSGAVEFVAFEKAAAGPGCYRVTVTYDAKPGGQDTSYEDKQARFCVSSR